MPRKLTSELTVPTLVQERLDTWGRCIHAQRVRQRITAADLAARMGTSRATLQRLERGDAGAAVSAYLSALLVLGMLNEAAPALEPTLWSDAPRQRVKLTQNERAASGNAEYF